MQSTGDEGVYANRAAAAAPAPSKSRPKSMPVTEEADEAGYTATVPAPETGNYSNRDMNVIYGRGRGAGPAARAGAGGKPSGTAASSVPRTDADVKSYYARQLEAEERGASDSKGYANRPESAVRRRIAATAIAADASSVLTHGSLRRRTRAFM